MSHKVLPEEFYPLMEQLQAIDFVLVELTLYLDTHPNDKDAIEQFNQYAYLSHQVRQQVEQYYGPLLQFGKSFSGYPWDWNQGPWPWQL